MSKSKPAVLILSETFRQTEPTRRQEQIQHILDTYLRQQLQR